MMIWRQIWHLLVESEISPEITTVRTMKTKSQEVTLSMRALDYKTESRKVEVKLVIDTGVNKTLISEEAWMKLKPHKGERAEAQEKLTNVCSSWHQWRLTIE